MALAIDGSVQSNPVTSGTTCSATLSTANANDVIIVGVVSNAAQNVFFTVSVSDTAGLTWTKRAEFIRHNNQNRMSYFYAVAPQALSNDVITAKINNTTFAYGVITAFGISGADTRAIFDPHAGLPWTLGEFPSDPMHIDTSNANDMIIGLFCMNSQPNPTAGSGFTLIKGANYQATEYKVVSAAQNQLAVGLGTGAGDTNAGVLDAIMMGTLGPPPPPPPPPPPGGKTVITASRSSDYSVLATDSSLYFHNTGAVHEVKFTLPANAFGGLIYTFTVVAPETVRIVASGGAIISCGQLNTAANGNIASAQFGASVTMYCKVINSTKYWFVQCLTGSWQVN